MVSHLRTPTKSQSIFGGSGGATAPTIEPPAWRDDATEPPTPTEVASDGGSGGATAPTIEPTEEVPSRGDEVPTIILPEVRDASTFAESTPEILLATIPQVIATSSASAASQKSETGSTKSLKTFKRHEESFFFSIWNPDQHWLSRSTTYKWRCFTEVFFHHLGQTDLRIPPKTIPQMQLNVKMVLSLQGNC